MGFNALQVVNKRYDYKLNLRGLPSCGRVCHYRPLLVLAGWAYMYLTFWRLAGPGRKRLNKIFPWQPAINRLQLGISGDWQTIQSRA